MLTEFTVSLFHQIGKTFRNDVQGGILHTSARSRTCVCQAGGALPASTQPMAPRGELVVPRIKGARCILGAGFACMWHFFLKRLSAC